jgi:hypothetical protein
MRILIRFLLACLILCLSATVWAEGFEMNRVSINTRKEDGCDQENWLAASAGARYDWLDLRLRAKLYFPQLSENWEDTSRDGLDDKYSGIRADFGFPSISKGLEAALSHKWNENYDINLAGLGYNWSPIDDLSLGLWCEMAKAEASDGSYNDYDRQKQQFSLSYTPDPWGYSLVVTRQDKNFKGVKSGPDSSTSDPILNYDYSYLKYSYAHQFTWQANSKLKLGLGYTTANTDYYNDEAKKDGTSDEWKLKANYKQNDYWSWAGSYSTWDCDGYNGSYNGNMFAVDATYSPEKSWSLTPKLRIADLDYSREYRTAYDDPEDKDKNADYHSRQYQAVALAYAKKYDKWAYDIEGFVKNYDYDESGDGIPDDNIATGVVGTLTWKTGKVNWYLQAAPDGSLTNRNGYYEARAEYRF